MPMHDWNRTPGWLWHQMQLGWTVRLCDACNRLLPSNEYYALTEYAAAPLDSSLAFDLSDTAFDGLDEEAFAAAKRRTVAVRRVNGHQKVALIEVLCPAIKSIESAYTAFIAKAVAAREMGLGLLVIDPFLSGKFGTCGIPAAIWKAQSGRALDASEDRPLALGSFLCGREMRALFEGIEIGGVLPNMQLCCDTDCTVEIPLEAAYMAAWQTFPAEWRNVITGEAG